MDVKVQPCWDVAEHDGGLNIDGRDSESTNGHLLADCHFDDLQLASNLTSEPRAEQLHPVVEFWDVPGWKGTSREEGRTRRHRYHVPCSPRNENTTLWCPNSTGQGLPMTSITSTPAPFRVPLFYGARRVHSIVMKRPLPR